MLAAAAKGPTDQLLPAEGGQICREKAWTHKERGGKGMLEKCPSSTNETHGFLDQHLHPELEPKLEPKWTEVDQLLKAEPHCPAPGPGPEKKCKTHPWHLSPHLFPSKATELQCHLSETCSSAPTSPQQAKGGPEHASPVASWLEGHGRPCLAFHIGI